MGPLLKSDAKISTDQTNVLQPNGYTIIIQNFRLIHFMLQFRQLTTPVIINKTNYCMQETSPTYKHEGSM